MVMNAEFSVLLWCTSLVAYYTCDCFARQKVSIRFQTTASGETLVLYKRSVIACVFCRLLALNNNKLCRRPPQYAPPLQVDLLTLKVMSESHDVGYLYANFSLLRPLCSRLWPNVRDRQTSDAHHCLMPPPRGWAIIIIVTIEFI